NRVVAIVNVFSERLILIELFAKLIKVGDLESGTQTNQSHLRNEFAEQNFKESGFAATVRSDDAHPVAANDSGGEGAHNFLVVPGKGDCLGIDNHPSA